MSEFKAPHPPPSSPPTQFTPSPSSPPGLVHSTGVALLIGFHSLCDEEEDRQFNTNCGAQIYLGIYNPLPLTRTYSGTFWDTWVLGKTSES